MPNNIPGIVITDFGSNDVGKKVFVQADGKIMVLGTTSGQNGDNLAMARYNSDGSLDTSFDSDGKLIITASLPITDTILTADGKFVTAGTSNADFAVARYNSDGTLDSSFDGDGKLTTDIAGTKDIARTLTVQADGKIVVAGGDNSGASYTQVARYNTDGGLDSVFSGDGKYSTTSIGLTPYSVAVQPNGKVVMAAPYSFYFYAIRLTYDGNLDSSFGSNGVSAGGMVSGNVTIAAINILTSGKIVVVGTSNGDFAAVRYNTDGSLDTSFGTSGKVVTDLGGTETLKDVFFQADGKFVCVGTNNTYDIVLARYNSNGSLDTSFNGTGKVITDLGGWEEGNHVAVQADGKIIVTGSINTDMLLVRYNSDGSLDSSFNASNHLPTGTVIIIGTAQQGQTLNASNSLADADGLGSITYSWQASTDGTNWSNITTGATLALTSAYVSKQIKVIASYIDGIGNAESVASSATPAVSNNNAPVSMTLTLDDNNYAGGSAPESIIALAGDDVLRGGGNNDTLIGGADNDLLYGDSGNDNLTGDADDDSLYGGNGNDSLVGNSDDDLLYGSGGNDLLYAGSTLVFLANDGINKLYGGSGNDTLTSGSDDDLLNGGSGTDTASYALATSAVHVNLLLGTEYETSTTNMDKLQAIENVIGGSGGDSLIGNNKANVLEGGAGNDSLVGYLGNDVAVFTGSYADYSFARDGVLGNLIVTDNVANRNGVDLLTPDIETVQFADGTRVAANLGLAHTHNKTDFNGDGKSDLLLTHTDGSVRAITLNGVTSTADAVVYNAAATDNGAWQVINSKGDYDGDGNTDLLLWNSSTSSAYLAQMNGTSISSQGLISYAQNLTGWTVADSSADYNQDGKSDLLWWNNATSTVQLYLHNGATASSSVQLFSGVSGWAIQSAGGDYNGDGNSDILFYNQSSSLVYMLTMDGVTVSSQGAISLPSSTWSIADAKGDYNGDGKSDMLLRNSSTGELWEYQMNGTTISSDAHVATVDNAWQVVSAHNDFNSDGKADILWKHTDGSAWISLIDGNGITSSVNLGAYAGWTVQNADNDVNADGKADVLWKHTDGSAYIMEMDGTSVIGGGTFGPYSGWAVNSASSVAAGDFNVGLTGVADLAMG